MIADSSLLRGVRRLLVACLLLSAPQVTAHEPAPLDPHRATPGVRLELVEASLTSSSDSSSPVYRPVVSGLPSGVVFDIWTKEFAHAFHEVASGFRLDHRGRAVSTQDGNGRPRYLDQMVLGPGPYFRGAIWEVALVSEDRTITAFAKVIPRPIVARNGPCEVSLEL